MALSGEAGRTTVEKRAPRNIAQKKQMERALVLSILLAGLGDLYCGSWIKAFFFFTLDLLCLLLVFAQGLGVFLYVLVWVCGLISAWISAGTSEKKFMRRTDDIVSHNI